MWSAIKDVIRDARAHQMVDATFEATSARMVDLCRLSSTYDFEGCKDLPHISPAELEARFSFTRPLSLGKCEPQEIGLQLLLQSSGASGTEKSWKPVPWPRMINWYLGDAKKTLLSMAYGANRSQYDENIASMAHVAADPGDVVQEFAGPLEGMRELSTTNGQPHFLLIGIHFLLDNGYATLIKQADGPDLIAPTAKLVERAQAQIAQAA